jgi:hypothetical protein
MASGGILYAILDDELDRDHDWFLLSSNTSPERKVSQDGLLVSPQ